jgi:hypothetical protein
MQQMKRRHYVAQSKWLRLYSAVHKLTLFGEKYVVFFKIYDCNWDFLLLLIYMGAVITYIASHTLYFEIWTFLLSSAVARR